MSMKYHSSRRGYTLIELIVAVGVFALIMTLAAGAYLTIIGVSRQTQATTTGINGFAFALENMARAVRTGSTYNCAGLGDCPNGGSSFSFKDYGGTTHTFDLSGGAIRQDGNAITDPLVNVTSLTFYANGTAPASSGDYHQANVVIVASGTVSAGPGKTVPFTIETSATMRGSDL